jgi:hypothetical protein
VRLKLSETETLRGILDVRRNIPSQRRHLQDNRTDQPGRVPPYPQIADTVNWSEAITLYDCRHFITYARLLDAERDNTDWREVARIILRRDPDAATQEAWLCWETHLARAKWIATAGFQQVARASAQINENRSRAPRTLQQP